MKLKSACLNILCTVTGCEVMKTRISMYIEAMDMSLMQLTNRIRREYFKGVLGPQELYHLIEAMFEDSPSREACLEEIAVDLF